MTAHRYTQIERFMMKVIKGGPTDCWIWTGAQTVPGWGCFRMDNDPGGAMSVGRASWWFHRGNPGDAFVCHTCDNGLCVNPDHLFLGTSADNVRDAVRKGRKHGVADWSLAKPLLDRGLSKSAVARALGVSHTAVAKAIASGRIPTDSPQTP